MSSRRVSFFGLYAGLALGIAFVARLYVHEILSNMSVYLDEVVDLAFTVMGIMEWLFVLSGVLFVLFFSSVIRHAFEIKSNPDKNYYGIAIKAIGWTLLVVATIVFLLEIKDGVNHTYLTQVIGSVFILGFGEIINLLHKIKMK